MSERYTSGYEKLEEEMIAESVDRFVAQKTESFMDIVSDDQDPRVIASRSMAAAVGFSMEAGQYIDLLNYSK